MKILKFFILFFSLNAFSQSNPEVKPVLDYLKKFTNVRDFTIHPNQNEAYFSIQSTTEKLATIAYIKKDKNGWSEPQMVSFSGKYKDFEPFLSTDGLRLYFVSDRPLTENGAVKDFDIWYVERKNQASNWSTPNNIGSPINTTANEFYPTVAENGNLYFTSDSDKSLGKDDIFMSVWNGKSYENPIRLEETINSKGYEFNAYVSPDETFLIYTIYGAPDGLGSGDLYISFKDENGNWKKAFNMGPTFNSPSMDYCPFYDATTQTLYFTSKRSSTTEKNFENLNEFEKEINQYQNGMSRIYKISMKEFLEKNK